MSQLTPQEALEKLLSIETRVYRGALDYYDERLDKQYPQLAMILRSAIYSMKEDTK